MKQERNCGCDGNYPIYPTYQPNFPGMMGGPMMNNQPYMPMNNYSNTEQQIANITSQINSLERRINNLESLVGNQNKYNNSNYQVM